MPRHAELFHQRARAAGHDLKADVPLSWLTPNGHTRPAVLEALPGAVASALDEIVQGLGGDLEALAAKTRGSMRADFVLSGRDIIVEYDEVQHFTTARQTSFS